MINQLNAIVWAHLVAIPRTSATSQESGSVAWPSPRCPPRAAAPRRATHSATRRGARRRRCGAGRLRGVRPRRRWGAAGVDDSRWFTSGTWALENDPFADLYHTYIYIYKYIICIHIYRYAHTYTHHLYVFRYIQPRVFPKAVASRRSPLRDRSRSRSEPERKRKEWLGITSSRCHDVKNGVYMYMNIYIYIDSVCIYIYMHTHIWLYT